MGSGIVRGKLASGRAQGKAPARLALRILHGENPVQIPVKTAEGHAYIFDHKLLKRLGTEESKQLGREVLETPTPFPCPTAENSAQRPGAGVAGD